MLSESVIAAPLCDYIFVETESKLFPIAMETQYRGENKGLYLDPITKTPWRVNYLNENQKSPLELVIKNGRLEHHNGNKANTEFDSDSMSFNHVLVVIDQKSRIFILPNEERGVFHHSSLTSGENILFAGSIGIHQGQIRELSDLSGHYRPNTQQTIKVLKHLSQLGLDISNLKLYGRVAQDLNKTHSMSQQDVQRALQNQVNIE